MNQVNSPIIIVGRYAGTPIDKLPNSYLRWMITQDFPKDWLEAARKKLKESDYNDLHLNVSRHAIDMFSKRFIDRWLNSESSRSDGDGLATYMAKLAEKAWEKGKDVSKKRHKDDGIVKEYLGIKWVFGVNPNYPDYKDVITVMPSLSRE
ncbi:hypothetical protein LCGC14_2705630 [marine sediment metagenome]|uniref:Uncharacterized protein n=1 Tax=marine sediment metagenome TaxID=412755 RepID=A0A0F8ZEH0_9ZZZZ